MFAVVTSVDYETCRQLERMFDDYADAFSFALEQTKSDDIGGDEIEVLEQFDGELRTRVRMIHVWSDQEKESKEKAGKQIVVTDHDHFYELIFL